jgi:anthranilate phosphoribosyltransferase
MIREAISALVEGRSLAEAEAAAVMEEIMSGEATPAQFGAFVTALRLKGETVDEIAGMARVMREKARRVHVEGVLLDTCGTGGDARGTFNVSTAAAFVAAGAGARVAKHGNRAMTSRCGSADVLEALGARIDLSPEQVKFAAGPRREIGVRTVFNILGPLTNPAGATCQVLGVADPSLAETMALVLARLGSRRAMVVHGDGLDEMSISGPTQVCELVEGCVRQYEVTPQEVGLALFEAASVAGGTPEENAAVLREVLAGRPGPRRDIVLLNAAAGLVALERAAALAEGVAQAAKAIDSGAARERLERFVAATNSFQ